MGDPGSSYSTTDPKPSPDPRREEAALCSFMSAEVGIVRAAPVLLKMAGERRWAPQPPPAPQRDPPQHREVTLPALRFFGFHTNPPTPAPRFLPQKTPGSRRAPGFRARKRQAGRRGRAKPSTDYLSPAATLRVSRPGAARPERGACAVCTRRWMGAALPPSVPGSGWAGPVAGGGAGRQRFTHRLR